MAFFNEMLKGFGQIFSAPYRNLEALWLLIPLLLMWIVLEIYFARFKKEELGWNTALANGITLGWITLEGMRSLFAEQPAEFWLRFTANIIIISYAFMIIYFSFTHKISSKWDFVIASPTPVYFLGIFSVLWGFGILEITRYVLLDLVILFIVVLIIIKIFRHFIKAAKVEEEVPEIPAEPELGKGEGLPPMGGLEEGPKGLGEGLGELPPLGKM